MQSPVTTGFMTQSVMSPAEGAGHLVTASVWVLDRSGCEPVMFLLERVLMCVVLSPQEALGAVEVTIRGRSGPESGTGSVMRMETGLGVRTKKTLVAPRMRQMMTAGPLSAAEQQPLHPVGLSMIHWFGNKDPIC